MDRCFIIHHVWFYAKLKQGECIMNSTDHIPDSDSGCAQQDVMIILISGEINEIHELHEVRTGPLLKPVQVPLDGIPSLQRVDRITQLGVVGKLAEGAYDLHTAFWERKLKGTSELRGVLAEKPEPCK